jgi:plastocyanin domain-containing protein
VVPSPISSEGSLSNEPVVIELTPAKTGEIAFACGMNMLHGSIVMSIRHT